MDITLWPNSHNLSWLLNLHSILSHPWVCRFHKNHTRSSNFYISWTESVTDLIKGILQSQSKLFPIDKSLHHNQPNLACSHFHYLSFCFSYLTQYGEIGTLGQSSMNAMKYSRQKQAYKVSCKNQYGSFLVQDLDCQRLGKARFKYSFHFKKKTKKHKPLHSWISTSIPVASFTRLLWR